MSEPMGQRDPLYLFACHLEWRYRGNLEAYQELLAALNDNDCEVRMVAEALLSRDRPGPSTSTIPRQSEPIVSSSGAKKDRDS
jgi:hypothetical protein